MNKLNGMQATHAQFIRLGKVMYKKDKHLAEHYFQVARDLQTQIQKEARNEFVASSPEN